MCIDFLPPLFEYLPYFLSPSLHILIEGNWNQSIERVEPEA